MRFTLTIATLLAMTNTIAAAPQGRRPGLNENQPLTARDIGGPHQGHVVTITTTVTVHATSTCYETVDAQPAATSSVGGQVVANPYVVPQVPSLVVPVPAVSMAASPPQLPAAASKTVPAVPAVPTIPTAQAAQPVAATPSQYSPPSVAAPPPQAAASSVALPAVNNVVGSFNAVEAVKAIMPKAVSCDGAPFPSECRTADQAGPLFVQAFTKWKIESKAAKAAVLALVALESGELKYQKAHYGDTPPGKGTRNMQYPNFNVKYATDALGAGAVAGKDPAAVLSALLADDATDFGSAAWFLSTQCPAVLAQFASNPSQAWSAYLGPGCVGTTDTPERDAYWEKAKKALGV